MLSSDDRLLYLRIQEFFSSVYTVETDHDFELLPSRITTDHIPMDEVVDSIEKKLARLKIDKSPWGR